MGLWDSIKDFGGGYFDGEMSSSGSGARVRVDVKDLPIIGDVNVVDVHVPGFKRGGEIPGRRRHPEPRSAPAGNRGDAIRASASGKRTTRPGPTTAEATEAGLRRGGTVPRDSSGRVHVHRDSRPRHPLADVAQGAAGGGPGRRQPHEIAPGIPCPTCASGITTPVR